MAELKRLADAQGLAVADSRSAASVADALEKLGPGHLKVLLASLSGATLKDVCRASLAAQAVAHRALGHAQRPGDRARARLAPPTL